MTEFRQCPTYPGYSASLDGIIRRDKPRADGSPMYLKSKPGMPRVNIVGEGMVARDRLVFDAWGDDAPRVTSLRYSRKRDRPAPLYEDGRVLTVAEWRAELALTD